MMCLGLSSCAPSFPAKSLTAQLSRLIKEEQNVEALVHISGKTLWVYLPLSNLVNEKSKDMGWNPQGLEKSSDVLGVIHRVVLSTDANLDFVALVGADVKNYGVELTTIEYVPDIKEAVLEKVSRGEFFMRSVRDINVNAKALNDATGESKRFYDISLGQFLSLQILHRTKTLFGKDKNLAKLFEIRSTSWSEKFGIIKLEIEFLRKSYAVSDTEAKINPLDDVKMLSAEVIRNYDFKTLQAIEITDTFASKSIKLSREDLLHKIKIKLPEYLD